MTLEDKIFSKLPIIMGIITSIFICYIIFSFIIPNTEGVFVGVYGAINFGLIWLVSSKMNKAVRNKR